MCNTKDIIEKAAAYFTNILGENVDFSPASKELLGRIPMTISSIFSLYEGSILGHQVILACIGDGDSISPAQMKKLLDIIVRQTGNFAVLATHGVSSYNKLRLIAQKVNFVIPNGQMFLPSLLLEIRPEKAIGADIKEAIPPFAQLLLLYHLQVASVSGANSNELSNCFSVSYSTVNKAIRWMESKDLIRLEGTKTKTIEVALKGRNLWEKALPLLKSPVEQVVYTDAALDHQMASGVNALSAYTMINEEPYRCCAVDKNDMRHIGVEYDKRFGENKIEVWKYPPGILSSTGVVDKLSLYLSLKDDRDERIQIELQRLIDEMRWLED